MAIERYSPRSASAILRKQAQAAALAHKDALSGRIEKPTVGDVIRIAGEFSTVRPATFHGYETLAERIPCAGRRGPRGN